MPRRGLCHCGTVLLFTAGPEGYKERCPTCGAVVRLRTATANNPTERHQKQRSGVLAVRPPLPSDSETPYPETPFVAAEQYNYDALAPEELPVVELVPLSELEAPPSFRRRWWLIVLAVFVVALVAGFAIVKLNG